MAHREREDSGALVVALALVAAQRDLIECLWCYVGEMEQRLIAYGCWVDKAMIP